MEVEFRELRPRPLDGFVFLQGDNGSILVIHRTEVTVSITCPHVPS